VEGDNSQRLVEAASLQNFMAALREAKEYENLADCFVIYYATFRKRLEVI
jgi:hypothetical protein